MLTKNHGREKRPKELRVLSLDKKQLNSYNYMEALPVSTVSMRLTLQGAAE